MNDSIDRQAAIDALDSINCFGYIEDSWDIVRGIIEHVPSVQLGWIPCSTALPENEQDVLLTVEVRPFGRIPYRRVVRAFYTDGKHTDADSAYSWDEFPNSQYDDKDNLIIPEGWWESSDYCEQQGMVDDFVIAWQPLPKPYKGE